MLTIREIASAADAKRYYAVSDYYSEGQSQETVGRWGGKLAARLGLSGTVTKDAFDRLCDNQRPDGSPLTLRTKDNRRIAYDFTFSAPKSFSIAEALASEAERGRLLRAFDEAVAETMAECEADMQCRVRKGGLDTDRTTGNMVWAAFDHSTARPVNDHTPPDMHRHKHVVVFSATLDAEESTAGRDCIKAGQFGSLKRDGEYYASVFYSRLASRLQAMGLVIDRRGGKQWEIAGVPQSVIDTFSKRTDQVESEAAKRGITDAVLKAELGAKTRSKKQKELTQAELREAWDAQLSDSERDALARVYRREIEGGPEVTPAEAVRFAIDHVSEQLSVFPERELKRVALLFGLGSVTPEQIDRELRSPVHGLIVEAIDGRRMATTERLQAEEDRIIGIAARGLGSVAAVGMPEGLKRGRLNDGQWAAVAGLLNAESRYTAVTGPAGAGKTDLLKTYAEGMAMAGRPVAFFATSSDAVAVLHRDGFTEAKTVAHFLLDERLQHSLRNGHVVVDETSLLGHKDALRFFELAETLNLRVTFVYDPLQHGSVPRGALPRLFDHAGIRPFRLKEIMRQRDNPGYLAAVESLAEGRTLEGFDTLASLGYVHEIADDGERFQALAAEYVRAIKDNVSCLVVSPTHAEASQITKEIRAQLREAGRLGEEEHAFTRLVAVHASEAERGQASTYRPGDVIQFHQNAKGGFTKGDRLIVGDAADVPLAAAAKFSVYRPQAIDLAVGDRLRFTGTVKTLDGKHTLKNGAVRTVAAIEGDRLKLDNGWMIDGRTAGHFRHGFVDTSFGSQGKTVRRVLLGMSAASVAAMNQEQMYVSASRGQERVTVYTDDKAAVRAAIRRSSRKLAAVDLRRPKPAKADPLRQHWGRLKRFLERRLRQAYWDGFRPSRLAGLHPDRPPPGGTPTHAERVQHQRREWEHER